MLNKIKSLVRDEDGAVTVDWVVLTAAVVALAGVAFVTIQESTGGVGSGVGSHLSSMQVD